MGRDALVNRKSPDAGVRPPDQLSRVTVGYKRPRDPVTVADRRANTLLVERLRDAFPGVPVVSAEGDPRLFGDFRHHERVLFVDPLDGTQEFIDRNGEFVVIRCPSERTHATVPLRERDGAGMLTGSRRWNGP
jgi:3'-phosphoadenosine 5'-phosphosulfate (PAPS) 3'-phosphatase